jgi:hypothetical protein
MYLFSFVTQRAMSMAPNYVAACVLPGSTTFFHIISQTAFFSGGRGVLNMRCVFRLSLQLSSKIFLVLRTTQRTITINNSSSCEAPAILIRF